MAAPTIVALLAGPVEVENNGHSLSQVASLQEFYEGNNRPVQPLNGRELLAGE